MNVQGTLRYGRRLAVRPMRDELADYQQMSAWLSAERVLEWFEGRDNPFPVDRIIAKYSPRVLAAEEVAPCIIELEGRAVGFIQYYPERDAAEKELDDAEGVWGLDMFIGDHTLWSQGVGTAALRLVCDVLLASPDARRLVIDPRVANPRAVRCYEKVGFRRVRVLPNHEFHEGRWWDNWLMELLPPTRD